MGGLHQGLNQDNIRSEKLKRISKCTLSRFNEVLERWLIIHDIAIARWASRIQEEENVPGFRVLENLKLHII